MNALYVVLGLSALVFLILIGMYNGLVSRRNAVKNGFASIDVQLKKRWDLIPQLVATTKGYADHEKEVLTDLTNARAARTSSERLQHEQKLNADVSRMIAVAEAYPELRSNENFLNLQRNLTEIESQISAARRAYNAAVTDNNDAVESFPTSILAGMFNFGRADWFEALADERSSVSVKF